MTVISATWVLVASAHEQPGFEHSINATRQLLEGREYELALLSLQQARLLPLNDEQLAAVALYEGLILADLGRQQQTRAASAFRTALRVAPLTQLPAKTSAQVERTFEAARARVLKERGQRSRPPQAPSAQDSPVLVALDEGLLLANLGQQQQDRAASAFTTALQLDPEAQLPIKTSPQMERAFEEIRAHVLKDLAYRLPTVAPSPGPRLNVTAPGPGATRPHLLGPAIFGTGLLISGGVFWGLARNEQSWLRRSNPIVDEAEEAELRAERGRAYQEMGFVLMGTGVAVIGAAASLHWLRKPELTLTLGAGTKGMSISVSGRLR